MNRQEYLELVKRNINAYGVHVALVSGPPTPAFIYSIGLSPTLGYELVLAGASIYSTQELAKIVNSIAEQCLALGNLSETMTLENLGSFSFVRADVSWSKRLLLGAWDFYGSEIEAMQIVPDANFRTIDHPCMDSVFDTDQQPWCWDEVKWTYSVPQNSMVATDLDVLRGAPILEATRFEEDYWEAFSTDSAVLTEEHCRIVPLSVLLGTRGAQSLLDLEPGKAIWRSSESSEWLQWK
jgi:Domain of unknown function (DUF4262)